MPTGTCGAPGALTRTWGHPGGGSGAHDCPATGAARMKFIRRAVHRRFERSMRYTEQRLGGAPAYKWLLRYVFPDHWSFLLGEIALYAFVVLVATGIFLTLYYIPSDTQVIYHGPYALLR